MAWLKGTADKPAFVVYDDLKNFGGFKSYKEEAQQLLSPRIVTGGKSARDRAAEPTYLHRRIVTATPDERYAESVSLLYGTSMSDFSSRIVTAFGRVLRAHGRDRSIVADHYADQAAARMASSLRSWDLDARTYINEVTRLSQAKLSNEHDRATLLFMLFVLAGCLANTAKAVDVVEGYARSRLAQDIATNTTDLEPMGCPLPEPPGKGTTLALVRVFGDDLRPPAHSLDPRGTTVGAIPSDLTPTSITDVESDVSRRHLLIWQEDGRWLCQGLQSTNGTILISGTSGERSYLEPPRNRRSPETTYPPLEIRTGDRLLLGKRTEFIAIRMRKSLG